MPTTQEIQSWLAANPTASDATIAAAMNQYGVTPAQMAAATGIAPEVVQSRYEAALPAPAPAPAPAPLSTVTAPAATTAPVVDVAKPVTSAPLSTVAAAAPVTPKATAEEIKNYFSGASGALPTMSQIQADMAKYNVTEADIKAATGKTLEELNPTLTYYTGKQYEGNQVLNLARQLATATDAGALKGGVFGEKGASIGFDFDQAKKVLGDNPSAVSQVLLDAAAGLIDKGITDLSQLKYGDITGQVNVRPEYDQNGVPTGRYVANWGGDYEGNNQQTRVLTPEEAAKVVSKEVGGADGSYTAYEPLTTTIGKGIYDSKGNLISNTGQLQVGETYTGPGGTQYKLTFDESGKPAFGTTGFSTGNMGDVAGILSVLQFVPGAQPFVLAANAALAAANKNPLGALASVAGIPGVSDFVNPQLASALTTANQVSNAVNAANKGDLLALVNAGVGATGVGGAPLGETGLTVGDALKTANFANAVSTGDPNAISRALSSIIGSQKTGTAGGITNRTYDDTIVSAGAKAFVDSKNVGASDADAYAAADAVMIDLESSRPDGATIKKDLGEFAGIDEAIQKNAMDDLVRADKLDLIKNTPNFNDAFSQARALLGPNQTFEWNGRQYSTATFAENPALGGNVVPGASSTTAGGGRGSYAGFDAAAAAESAGKSNKPAAEAKDIKETGFWSNLADSISNQMNLSSKAANDYLKNNPNSPITKSVSEAYEAAGELIKNAGGGTALMLDNKPVADALVKGGSDLINLGQSLGTGPQDTKNWNETLSLIDKADGLKEKLAVLAGRVMDGTSGLGRQTAIELKQELPALFLGGGSFKASVLAAGVIDAGDTGGSVALDEYQKSIKAGKSHQESLSDARTAGIAAGATELAVDLTLGKLAEFAVGKLGSVGAKAAGRVAGETVTEGVQEGAAAGAVDIASGRAVDVNNMLTNMVAGAAVGHSTSLSTAALGAAQDVGEADEIKSTIGNINSSVATAAKSGDVGSLNSAIETSIKLGADAGVDQGSLMTITVGSALANGASVDATVNSAVNAALSTDAGNAEQVATDIFSAVNAVDGNIVATESALKKSLIDLGVSQDAASSIVSTAKNNASTTSLIPGVTTKSDAVTKAATDADITTASKTDADTGANVKIETDAATGITTQVTTDANTNTQTTVTTDPNTNTTTQTVVNSNNNTKTEVSVNADTNVTTQVTTDPNTNTKTTVTTDPNTNTQTVVVVDVNTGEIIVDEVMEAPEDWMPPDITPVPPVEPPVVPTVQTPKTATPKSKTPTPKKATPQAAGLAGGVGAMLPSGFDMESVYLPSKETQKAIDPLQRVMEAQAELEKTAMMQQIDPRLLGLLQQRMTPEQQPGQPQQFNKDIGALAQLLSGQPTEAANENPYYSYGSEDSIDSILGGKAANYAEGGYVEPLKAAGGAMALPLLAKSGGALGHYGGREDFKDGKHVAGEGDGQSDDIPAWLADGEFVFPADVVSALGNGSTKAGTDKLYEMMHSIRDRARSKGPEDLPPPALKSPLDYLKSHKRSK